MSQHPDNVTQSGGHARRGGHLSNVNGGYPPGIAAGPQGQTPSYDGHHLAAAAPGQQQYAYYQHQYPQYYPPHPQYALPPPIQPGGQFNSASRHIQSNSAYSTCAREDEDWTQVQDIGQRRRLQNRIAQRKYRSKLKSGHSEAEKKYHESGTEEDYMAMQAAKAKMTGNAPTTVTRSKRSTKESRSRSPTPSTGSERRISRRPSAASPEVSSHNYPPTFNTHIGYPPPVETTAGTMNYASNSQSYPSTYGHAPYVSSATADYVPAMNHPPQVYNGNHNYVAERPPTYMPDSYRQPGEQQSAHVRQQQHLYQTSQASASQQHLVRST